MGTLEFENKVKCVVNNFGMTDLTDPNLDWDTEFMQGVVQRFFGGVSINENPELYRDLLPLLMSQ